MNARALIMKQYEDPLEPFKPRKRRDLSPEEAAAFVAFGDGPTHEKLRDAFDRELRGNPERSPEQNFAWAWRLLSPGEQDEIRAEENGEAQARVAQDAARRRATKGTSTMGKDHVSGLLDAVASVYADELSVSEREYVLSKVAEFYKKHTGRDAIEDIRSVRAAREAKPLSKAAYIDAVHAVSESKRESGETVEQARAKYWQSAEGQTVRQALKRLPADEPAPRAQPVVSPGMAAFAKAAAERAAKTGISIAAAKLAIAESRDIRDRAIWTTARSEARA